MADLTPNQELEIDNIIEALRMNVIKNPNDAIRRLMIIIDDAPLAERDTVIQAMSARGGLAALAADQYRWRERERIYRS